MPSLSNDLQNGVASVGDLLYVSGQVISEYLRFMPGGQMITVWGDQDQQRILPSCLAEYLDKEHKRVQAYKTADAYLDNAYNATFKAMYVDPFGEPKKVIYIGWKHKYVGRSYHRKHSEDTGYLDGVEAVLVLTVVPFTPNDQRYHKPFDVLPNQVIGRVRMYAHIGVADLRVDS